jgi:hypothetical protein
MNPNRHAGRIALGALALVSNSAWSQATFYGAQLVGGWPTAQIAANADWSSDLGVDYRYSASANGSAVEWSGQGRNWSSRAPYGTFESGFSLGWEGTARGGLVGQTHSGGEISVGPTLALTGGAVSRQTVHLWSTLGANDPGYGIGTDARHNGYASIFLGTQPVNLHWRLDWVSTVQGNALTAADFHLAGAFDQAIGGTSGSASGFWAYGASSSGQWVYPDFRFTSSAEDWAGDPRAGRIDTRVTIRFSAEPILTPVPEPATWVLMLGGLALWGVRGAGRRCRRAGSEAMQARTFP